MKKILLTLLLLVGFTVALVWVVFRNPSVILTPQTLRFAADQLASDRFQLDWDTLNIQVTPLPGPTRFSWQRRIEVNLSRPCVHLSEPEVNGCFETAVIEATVVFENLRFRVKKIGPIRLDGGDFVVRIPTKTQEPSRSQDNAQEPFNTPEWLHEAELGDLSIRLKRYLLVLENRRYEGELALEGDEQPARKGARTFQLTGEARSLSERESLKLAGRFELPDNPLELTRQNWSVRHSLQGILRRAGSSVRFQETGNVSTTELSTRMNADLIRVVGDLRKVSLSDCFVSLKSGKIVLDCPVDIPALTSLRITGQADHAELIPDPSKPLSGLLDVDLMPRPTRQGSGTGELHVSFSGIPENFPRGWKIDAQLSSRLRITNVEKILPAPFAVLKGDVDLEAQATSSWNEGHGTFKVSARLGSQKQRLGLDLKGSGQLDATSGARASPALRLRGIQATLALSDVTLELPRFDLLNPPSLFPDPRFQGTQASTKKPAAGTAPDLDLRIASAPGEPLHFLSSLAKDPIPLHLDLSVSSAKPTAGTVAIQDFEVTAFGRRAHIDQLRLAIASPFQESQLQGAIRVPSTDYSITILLHGTVNRPQIRFRSSPPMAEEKIIAVLLFGVPFDDLDPDQGASVANTLGAVSEGVLGLASLYALASTPVERIGYDPRTGTVSVRVRLAEGTSFTYRFGEEEREFGLRKRLGSHWVLSTDLTRATELSDSELPTNRSSSIASTFIEWHARY